MKCDKIISNDSGKWMHRASNFNFLCFVQNWAPPFAVDVDKFKFVPRIQKINELEVIFRHYDLI